MVRVLCLDEDEPDDAVLVPSLHQVQIANEPPTLNNKHGFTMALRCYPIVSQLATQLDLTSLHELSRTCRQFRASLLQHRKLLIAQTLRCENELETPAHRLGKAFNESVQAWITFGRNDEKVERITSGRVGACARDLVDECRKCGTIVCRNCIMKPPARPVLRGRHRRLCKTCMRAPLNRLTSLYLGIEDEYLDYTQQLISRTPCTCEDHVWICSPCGQSLRAADTTYMRGWSWRTRYSTCGGFGTGLGEGVEGVECGRGESCFDTRVVEKEVECDADELAAIEAETERARLAGHAWAGSSYMKQEMVGIGGQVKIKVKKMVVVGAVVKEHEDERADGNYLSREQQGRCRSWCSWCDRVVPAVSNKTSSTTSDSSSSSSS